MTNIVWLRRNLRIDDNIPLRNALISKKPFICVFIFDPSHMEQCVNDNDLRVTFIAQQLCLLRQELQHHGQQLFIFHTQSTELIPQLAKLLNSHSIFADHGFEPCETKRDQVITQALNPYCQMQLFNDHLLLHPKFITKSDTSPYKVYTPYMKAFRRYLQSTPIMVTAENDLSQAPYSPEIKWNTTITQPLKFHDAASLVDNIGYSYNPHPMWNPQDAEAKFRDFIQNRIIDYKSARDFMSANATSTLSPYLRFGLLSIRKIYNVANLLDNEGSNCWINELIWREFYTMLLLHFPNIINEEMQPPYIHTIVWRNESFIVDKICRGETGFPIIDASVRELLATGWMHNRMRMVFASFFTKNLLLDWRIGEQFFAKYLMDYELASNIGGWQWAASVGSDAQPYFRIFNPLLQSQKFDPDGIYIKRHLPQLAQVTAVDLHRTTDFSTKYNINYPKQMVDLKSSRSQAISIFKNATSS